MTETLDLHGMSGEEASTAVSLRLFDFENSDSHVTTLIIIFGNGKGILRYNVLETVEAEGYSYKELNSGAIEVYISKN